MTGINWTSAVGGGLLIGSAAALFFWLNGRIAGVSGIFGDLFLDRGQGRTGWRLMFIVGLVAGCALVRVLHPEFGEVRLQAGWVGTLLAGLLVGYGTRMGCGCTSGHGICGMSRLSPRSIVATVVFIASAMLTVAGLRHWGASA